jgi:hypothetical protein
MICVSSLSISSYFFGLPAFATSSVLMNFARPKTIEPIFLKKFKKISDSRLWRVEWYVVVVMLLFFVFYLSILVYYLFLTSLLTENRNNHESLHASVVGVIYGCLFWPVSLFRRSVA